MTEAKVCLPIRGHARLVMCVGLLCELRANALEGIILFCHGVWCCQSFALFDMSPGVMRILRRCCT